MTLAADRQNLKLAQSARDAAGVYNLVLRQYETLANKWTCIVRRRRLTRHEWVAPIRSWSLAENALNLLTGVPTPEDLLPSDLAGVRPRGHLTRCLVECFFCGGHLATEQLEGLCLRQGGTGRFLSFH